MELIKRVNYTVLPVILGGFILAGLATYYAFYSLYYFQMKSFLAREVVFFHEETDRQYRSARAGLSEILGSAEMKSYLSSKAARDYQVYALESALFRVLGRAHDTNEYIKTIHILETDGNVLVAARVDDPFAENPLAADVLEAIEALQSDNTLTHEQLLMEDEDGAYTYILIHKFSPSLLITDRFVSKTENLHYGVMALRFAPLDVLKQGISEFTGQDFDLFLTPIPQAENLMQPSNHLEPYHLEVKGKAGQDMVIQSQTGILALQVKINEKSISGNLTETKWLIGAVSLIISLLSFIVLRFTIKRRIVKPIKELVKNIKKQDEEGKFHLERMPEEDEVAELNNAYVGLMDDIQQLASFDPLTGLANRRRFSSVLDRQLYQAKRASQNVALMFIDLDNFKRVNDQYGHATGDRLLQVFADRLIETVRPTDEVALLDNNDCARLAGDEFAVMLSLPKMQNHLGVKVVADRILELFKNGFEVDGIIHNVHASIGIAFYPEDGESVEELLQHSDATMYHAKKSGKNRYHFFDGNISKELDTYRYIENELFQALKEGAFKLVYMPVFNGEGSLIEGAEVLLRCPPLMSAGYGPDQFIPVAESTGLIKQIDLWVLEAAFQQLQRLQKTMGFCGIFAINISAQELHNEDFPKAVEQLLTRYQIDPVFIELELTETSMVSNDANSVNIMERLKALGVSLSLDDFGTGYTAFNQLGSYPVDCLKIDRSFVDQLGQLDTNEQPMVDVILTLARMYDLRVIAEGVETLEQMQYLQNRGCDQLQGYYLSKPLEWDDLCDLISAKPH